MSDLPAPPIKFTERSLLEGAIPGANSELLRNTPTDDRDSIEFWNGKVKEFYEVQALADEFERKQTAVEIRYLHKSKGQPEHWLLMGGGRVVYLRLARLIRECLGRLGEFPAGELWETWVRRLASDSGNHLILPVSNKGKIGRSYATGAFERYIRENSFNAVYDSVQFCRLQAEERVSENAFDSNVTKPALGSALTPLADTTGIAAVPNVNRSQVYERHTDATDANGTLSHSLGRGVEAGLETKERKSPHGRLGKQVKSLRRYRQEAKLTQAELAELASLSVEHVSCLERGTRNTSQRKLESLADALSEKLGQKISTSLLCAEPT
jgi:DNA-binding XRE family transcriptional regulator